MPRRVLRGEVVSTKADKTAVISVVRAFKHPLYGKTIRRSKKYHAHDPKNECNLGDTVKIAECAPFSKLKRWEVLEVKATGSALDAELE